MKRIEDIEAWLEAKHVTLWANWDIQDPKRRKLAAEWLDDETRSLYEFLRDRDLSGWTAIRNHRGWRRSPLPPPKEEDRYNYAVLQHGVWWWACNADLTPPQKERLPL